MPARTPAAPGTSVGLPTSPPPTSDRTARLLRAGLLVLTGLSAAATAWELAAERHWGGSTQLVAWATLGVLLIALALAVSGSPRLVTAARILALVVLAASAFGIVEHVLINVRAGHLDPHYGAVWNNLPTLQRLWLGVTKSVGKAPPLAPGALGQSALLLLLGTLGRTGRARSPELGIANVGR